MKDLNAICVETTAVPVEALENYQILKDLALTRGVDAETILLYLEKIYRDEASRLTAAIRETETSPELFFQYELATRGLRGTANKISSARLLHFTPLEQSVPLSEIQSITKDQIRAGQLT